MRLRELSREHRLERAALALQEMDGRAAGVPVAARAARHVVHERGVAVRLRDVLSRSVDGTTRAVQWRDLGGLRRHGVLLRTARLPLSTKSDRDVLRGRMRIAAHLLTGFVALEHVYFLVLEMFLWATPFGVRTFQRTMEEQQQTKVLAQNQGLYNGFLAAGLAWSFFAGDMQQPLRVFFLACIVVAGVYGAATASKKILFLQAVPAALALVVVIAR